MSAPVYYICMCCSIEAIVMYVKFRFGTHGSIMVGATSPIFGIEGTFVGPHQPCKFGLSSLKHTAERGKSSALVYVRMCCSIGAFKMFTFLFVFICFLNNETKFQNFLESPSKFILPLYARAKISELQANLRLLFFRLLF